MGTRAITFVYDEFDNPILNLFRQYDGYPAGHGHELGEFLANKKVVNGLSGDTSEVFNGMGCLAASLVANFKKSAGGFYIHSVDSTDCGQDYEYHIYKDRIVIKGEYMDETLFDGPWEEFVLENFGCV